MRDEWCPGCLSIELLERVRRDELRHLFAMAEGVRGMVLRGFLKFLRVCDAMSITPIIRKLPLPRESLMGRFQKTEEMACELMQLKKSHPEHAALQDQFA